MIDNNFIVFSINVSFIYKGVAYIPLYEGEEVIILENTTIYPTRLINQPNSYSRKALSLGNYWEGEEAECALKFPPNTFSWDLVQTDLSRITMITQVLSSQGEVVLSSQGEVIGTYPSNLQEALNNWNISIEDFFSHQNILLIPIEDTHPESPQEIPNDWITSPQQEHNSNKTREISKHNEPCPNCGGTVHKLHQTGSELYCMDCDWDNLDKLP